MKTHYKVWFGVIFIFFITLPCWAQEHLVISRSEDQWGVATLMGERILKEAYARLGIDFEFLELPNRRALAMANNGGTDRDFGVV